MAETRTDEKGVPAEDRGLPKNELPTEPIKAEPAKPEPVIERTPGPDPAYNPARPETRKTPIDNPPDGKKDETISVVYHPAPGDPEETELFGKKVVAGEPVEVPAKHAEKARGNPTLSVEGEKTFGDEQREQQETDESEEQEEATFEENVARERSEEYLQGRATYIPNTAPGEAERVARAQQQAAEMQAALESDDKDKPRKRGRPRKADQEA